VDTLCDDKNLINIRK